MFWLSEPWNSEWDVEVEDCDNETSTWRGGGEAGGIWAVNSRNFKILTDEKTVFLPSLIKINK